MSNQYQIAGVQKALKSTREEDNNGGRDQSSSLVAAATTSARSKGKLQLAPGTTSSPPTTSQTQNGPSKAQQEGAAKSNSKLQLATGSSPSSQNVGVSSPVPPELDESQPQASPPPQAGPEQDGSAAIEAVLADEEDPSMTAKQRMLDGAVDASDVKPIKKKWLPSRKALLIIGFIVAIAVAVGVALGVTLGGNDKDASSGTERPTDAPTMVPSVAPSEAPTTNQFSLVAPLIESLFGPRILEDSTSPQYRAAQWMAEVDQAFDYSSLSDLNEERFMQRYALVVFYYATGGDVSWNRQSNFLSPTLHECDWKSPTPAGVFTITGFSGVVESTSFEFLSDTNDRSVAMIELIDNNMSGTLPEEIGALSRLYVLALNINNIGGPLPMSLYGMPNLQFLSIPFNDFTGTLPTEIGKATGLIQLWLERSPLTRTLPSELGNLSNLLALTIVGSSITGSIPESILGLQSSLFLLDLSRNSLNGTITVPSTGLPNLETFTVLSNNLSGSVPDVFGARPLESYAIANNSFTGTIPESIVEADELRIIFMDNNNITGTLPQDWSRLSSTLTTFGIQNNRLSGTLPSSLEFLTLLDLFTVFNNQGLNGTIPDFGAATSLRGVQLSKNECTGTVPTSYVELTALDYLILQENMLTGDLSFLCNGTETIQNLESLFADCLGEVICPCCHLCCNELDECALNNN